MKRKPHNHQKMAVIHKSYQLALAALVVFGGLAANYSWTFEHNRLVRLNQDEAELHAFMDMPEPEMVLLAPPVLTEGK